MERIYAVRASDVAIPPDAKLGQYQRTIRPFENWTLICDRNLAARQMVCNVTQQIQDQWGNIAFSWSLAATKEGKPFMILRAPANTDSKRVISLDLPGQTDSVEVKIDSCNTTVCIGFLPVGSLMRQQIEGRVTVRITYTNNVGDQVSIAGPLKGLSAALGSIQ